MPLHFWNFNNQNGKDFSRYILSRNYETIHLTNNNLAIESIKSKIKKFVQSKDTLYGMHFLFHSNATFKTFIDVVNLCKSEKVKVIVPFENHIWLANQQITKRPEMLILGCGSGLYLKNLQVNSIKPEQDKTNYKMIQIFKSLVISFIIFSIIILINIIQNRNILKSLKN
jgi:hypothetical protein